MKHQHNMNDGFNFQGRPQQTESKLESDLNSAQLWLDSQSGMHLKHSYGLGMLHISQSPLATGFSIPVSSCFFVYGGMWLPQTMHNIH